MDALLTSPLATAAPAKPEALPAVPREDERRTRERDEGNAQRDVEEHEVEEEEERSRVPRPTDCATRLGRARGRARETGGASGAARGAGGTRGGRAPGWGPPGKRTRGLRMQRETHTRTRAGLPRREGGPTRRCGGWTPRRGCCPRQRERGAPSRDEVAGGRSAWATRGGRVPVGSAAQVERVIARDTQRQP